MMTRQPLVALVLLVLLTSVVAADNVRVKEIATVEGVRTNSLVGYGVVVGLNGTGDRRQTVFTTQTLANVMQNLGIQVPATAMRVNNVAAVIVTATLPPFASPGTQLDVTVSSIGDAKSIEGGFLVLTPLRAADGQVYAAAQGAVALGGYAAGAAGNSKQLNHPTAGRIPNGGIVERDSSFAIAQQHRLALLLRDADFEAARDIAATINQRFSRRLAKAIDGRRIELQLDDVDSIPSFLADVQELRVTTHPVSKVVVNERTGTVVIGHDVRLSAVSILHGSLSIEIATHYVVSQPAPLSSGSTTVVPETELKASQPPAKRIELPEGATVEDLIRGLQMIGATARDTVAILQAIKAAGGLSAELELI